MDQFTRDAVLPNEDMQSVSIEVCNGPGMLQILHNVFAEYFDDIAINPRDFCINVPLFDPRKGENVWQKRLGLHCKVHSRIAIAGCERLNQDEVQLSAYFVATSDIVSLERTEVDEWLPCDPTLKISILYYPRPRDGTAKINVATYLYFLEQGRRKGLWL